MGELTFEELSELIINWAQDKGILANATPLAQMGKTLEEVEELTRAVMDDDRPEIIDGIGDTLVTLIIQAHMQDININDALFSVYNIISKRTGRMIDGVFVKDA